MRGTRGRERSGCGAVVLAGFVLFWLVVGGGLAVKGTADLWQQLGFGKRPVVRLAIDACHHVGSPHGGRNLCSGHQVPGLVGGPGTARTMGSAEHAYPPGSVITVRCRDGGGCSESGPGEAAGDLAMISFGLLLFTFGAGLVALYGQDRLHGGAFRPGRRLHLLGAWTGVLLVVLVASGVTRAVL